MGEALYSAEGAFLAAGVNLDTVLNLLWAGIALSAALAFGFRERRRAAATRCGRGGDAGGHPG